MQNIENAFNHLLELSKTSIVSHHSRKALLKLLLKSIENNRESIGNHVYKDFRKNSSEVVLTEVIPLISELRSTIKNLKKWTKPKKVRKTLLHFTSKAFKIPQPKGVVLIIAPWNYPFNLVVSPLISAIAAGNRVIIKPSEFTPNSSAILKKIIGEVFSEDQVIVIEGDSKVSAHLTSLPFNHIFFTGSPAIGRKVMKAASKNLCSVTLELGGKSPCIVSNFANLKNAAKRIVWGKFLNAGQTCIAPDYILVHHSVKDEFINLCNKFMKDFYPYTSKEDWLNSDYCGVVTESHTERIKNLIDDALRQGATANIGNEIDISDRFVMPTILSDVSFEMEIMQEEIFGPVLPVLTYDLFDEALQKIKNQPRPLAGYIFTKKNAQINTFRKEVITGGIVANDVLSHYVHKNLPFGGVNNSGIGRSHGYEGFLEFSNILSFLKTGPGPFSAADLLSPPYTDKKKKLIDFAAKFIR